MTALGNNAHIFARPARRDQLKWCFENALGCGEVATVSHHGMTEPMLVVRFPAGGHLSIEFIEDAPDDNEPRLGAWLELRAQDPAALFQSAIDAGLTPVKHPGHTYYFMAPGGQVFTILPASRLCNCVTHILRRNALRTFGNRIQECDVICQTCLL